MNNVDSIPAEADISDDRPLAVRRKRRLTGGLAGGEASSSQNPGASIAASTKTPTKAKKKVRFSDPRPDISGVSSSTGLTPALKRTRVRDAGMPPPKTPDLFGRDPHQRQSLPLDLSNALPSQSPTPPATPLSGEIQYTPFRQVLDERLKRRLRRNRMSEEQNTIDAENNKTKAELRQEMQELRDELAAVQRLQQETNNMVKGEDGNHVQQLEHEIEILKREMRDRSMTAEPLVAGEGTHTQTGSTPPIYSEEIHEDFIMVDAEEQVVPEEPSLPSNERGILRDTTHLHVDGPKTDAASQTSTADSNAENDAFRDARLALERLFPGEIALGLRTSSPQPLLNAMIERLQNLKTQVLISNDSLMIARTSENNLRNQFNAMLEQLHRARTFSEGIVEERDREKELNVEAQEGIQSLRQDLAKAGEEVKLLQKDLGDSERSVQKLQDALETYRADVGRLELLITNMESEHKDALKKIQEDMDEAVADLECQVAAEEVGRRAAEGESVDRGERIKQLKRLESELRDSMNEKQEVIRDLEKELTKVQEEKEKDVGSLNVEIGKLASNLNEARVEMNKLKAENKTLLFRIEEEKAAGMKAIQDVQAEMARCVEQSEDVKNHHVKNMQSRGTEVNEHKGLLTPVTGGRFKDVEGYVEVKRGKAKRRPDSGIHVVEEEDEGDDDVMLDSDL